jgi:hypothetical protein
MRRLNRMVDEGRKSPRAAALAFFAPRRASP